MSSDPASAPGGPAVHSQRSVSARANHFAVIAALCLMAAILLSLTASGDNILPGDVAITTSIQEFTFPGDDVVERAGYHGGSLLGCLLVGTVASLLLLFKRRWSATLLIALVLAARIINPLLKRLIDSPRPTSDLVHVAANATSDPATMGFPSGHVSGSVLFYGGLIYIAQVYIASTGIRVAVQIASIAMVLIVGWSRIYSGAHWPSDVLGGFLWGSFFLLLICAVHGFATRQWTLVSPAPGSISPDNRT